MLLLSLYAVLCGRRYTLVAEDEYVLPLLTGSLLLQLRYRCRHQRRVPTRGKTIVWGSRTSVPTTIVGDESEDARLDKTVATRESTIFLSRTRESIIEPSVRVHERRSVIEGKTTFSENERQLWRRGVYSQIRLLSACGGGSPLRCISEPVNTPILMGWGSRKRRRTSGTRRYELSVIEMTIDGYFLTFLIVLLPFDIIDTENGCLVGYIGVRTPPH